MLRNLFKKKPMPPAEPLPQTIVACRLYPNITCPKCGLVLELQLDRTFKCKTPQCPLSKGTFEAPALNVIWTPESF